MNAGAGLPIVDCHMHLFPSVEWDHRDYLDPGRTRPGLVPDVLAYMKQNGVARGNFMLYPATGRLYRQATVDLPAGPEAAKIEERARRKIIARALEYNEWGVKTCQRHPELSCLIWLDVVRMEPQAVLQELEDKVRRGATGIKLVPYDLPVRLDDRRLWPVYDYCHSHGVPFFTHASPAPREIAGQTERWGDARFAAEPLKAFPRLKMCFVSLAGGDDNAMVEMAREHKNAFGEFGGRLARSSPQAPESYANLIRAVGAERVMFGTNFGSGTADTPLKILEAFSNLPITDQEREDIAYKTWDRFISK